MSQRIDPSWVRRFVMVAVMAAVIKSGMLVWSFFLPSAGVEYVAPRESGLERNLYKPSKAFGLESQKAEQPVAGKKSQVYKLDKLTLKGIYTDGAFAFISVSDGSKDTLIVKGEQFQGYTLSLIFPDRAVFEKGGRRYELDFKEEKENKSFTMTKAEPDVISDNGFTSIKRKEIKFYTDNFDAIWENIKIQEVFENKKLKGFEVKWIKKGSIFAKMGLEENDVITGINGKPVTSVSQVLKIYQDIDKIDNLTLEIKRNNKERQLDYAIYD